MYCNCLTEVYLLLDRIFALVMSVSVFLFCDKCLYHLPAIVCNKRFKHKIMLIKISPGNTSHTIDTNSMTLILLLCTTKQQVLNVYWEFNPASYFSFHRKNQLYI